MGEKTEKLLSILKLQPVVPVLIVDDAKSGEGGTTAAASEFSLRDPGLPFTVGAGATAGRPGNWERRVPPAPTTGGEGKIDVETPRFGR